MTDVVLTLVAPQAPRDCVAEAFWPLVRSPLWAAYLTYDGSYLGDLNDDPDSEDAYDTGLALWTETVPAIFTGLSRLLMTRALEVSVSVEGTGSATRAARRLVGHPTPEVWVEDAAAPGVDLVEGLSTYGGQVTAWVWMPDRSGDPASTARPRLADLENSGPLSWVSHGYKEPFLVGHTPTSSLATVAELLRRHTGLPVVVEDEAFVPHRVRVHRLHSPRGGRGDP